MLNGRNIDEEGLHNLICAVTMQAVKDVEKGPGKHGGQRAINYNSAVNFFKSDWFEEMTGLDSNAILDKLTEMKNEKRRNYIPVIRRDKGGLYED